MVAVIPQTPFGRLGAVLSALIVACSLIGLTMHRDFYAGKPRRHFFSFYTNVSNLLVLLYFALLAPRLYAGSRLRALIPHIEFSVMMSIMLTFAVFHLLLFPAIFRQMRHAPRDRAFFLLAVDNLFIHYLVPWLVFLYWLLCSPGKARLGLPDALLWTLIPLVYAVFVLLRAPSWGVIEETGSPYPYPFLDVQAQGIPRVAGVCALLYLLCAGAGLFTVSCLRVAFSCFGGGHALLLID